MALSPFIDGTPSVSQHPIPPAHFFDYKILVPIGMAGTYFYYSHVGFQAVSAAGPLIVDEQVGGGRESYTKPLNTSFLQIGTGQRSSLLTTKTTKTNPEKEIYYIQLETRERPTLTRPEPDHEFKLIYYYPPSAPPLTLPNTTLGFLDYQLSPLSLPSDFPAADQVTRRVTITVHQNVLPNDGPTIWVQNSYDWMETFPQEPYLISLYKNDSIELLGMERALENEGIDLVTRTLPAQIGRNGTYDVEANERLWEEKVSHQLFRFAMTVAPAAVGGFVANIILSLLATIAVTLRFISRKKSGAAIKLDDWTILSCLVLLSKPYLECNLRRRNRSPRSSLEYDDCGVIYELQKDFDTEGQSQQSDTIMVHSTFTSERA
ncbi:hypothetical protein G7Y89_g14045 [Cudoniella acicularis]|uniref:Plastocyanin-like domain-containing protein n=1 Tax=Cudoniella acicularis TaxID=354080 RepID=A0A8H4R8C7_9HELO|nr:hypothetical protein G7Y89_g14045 [Cudoniella acicularis]